MRSSRASKLRKLDPTRPRPGRKHGGVNAVPRTPSQFSSTVTDKPPSALRFANERNVRRAIKNGIKVDG